MTLHEAISLVLRTKGEHLKPREIAIEINRFSLYRMKDGKVVSPGQILTRANKYPDHFIVYEDGSLGLRSINIPLKERFLAWVRNFSAQNFTPDVEVVIPFILFTFRMSKREDIDDILLKVDNIIDYEDLGSDLVRICRDGLESRGIEMPADFFEIIWQSLNNFGLEALEVAINELWFSLISELDLLSDVFVNLFEDTITQLGNSKSKANEFGTPIIVANFISQIADVQENDTVSDPFAGMSILLNKVVGDNERVLIYANDINRNIGAIGIMNLVVSGNIFFKYSFSNAFTKYTPPADWLITNPPVGIFNYTSKRTHTNNLATLLDGMNPEGLALIIIPDSILYSGDKKYVRLREDLLKSSYLAGVISLPRTIFQPFLNVPTSIIHIDRRNAQKSVFFLDLSQISREEFEYKSEYFSRLYKNKSDVSSVSGSIPTSGLLEKRSFDLLPRKNLLNDTFLRNYNHLTRLGSIIQRKLIGKTFSSLHLNDESDGIPYVRISDLSKARKSFTLSSAPEKYISKISLINGNRNQVGNGDIMLAKVGNNLYPTIYAYHEKAVISNNLFAFTIDFNRILPEYLVHELEKQYIKDQLEAIQIRGVGANYFHGTDLMEIMVDVPEIATQRASFKSADSNSLGTNISWSIVSENREANNVANEKKIIASIKHRIAQFMSPINNDLNNLEGYMKDRQESEKSVSLDDPAVNMPGSTKVKDVFKRIHANMSSISRTFSLMHNVLYFSPESTNQTQVDLAAKFEDFAVVLEEELKGVVFMIGRDEHLRAQDLLIKIDENQMEELFRNFVFNSITHGFDGSITPKVVYIYFSKSPDSNYLEVSLINNGLPFPFGLSLEDFTNFGQKGTNSPGTGIGGYLMKKIVDNHEGKLEWFGDRPYRYNLIDPKGNSINFLANVNFKISLPYTI